MNIYVISLFVLPFAIAIGVLFTILNGKKENLGKLYVFAKVLCSLLFVAMAILGVYLKGENPLSHLVVWALILFAVADGTIELNFMLGMANFLVGHVLFITWVIMKTGFTPAIFALLVPAFIIMMIIFRKSIASMRFKAIPLFAYALLLCTEMAVCVMAGLAHGAGFFLLAAGGVMFYISDIFVAKGEFMTISRKEGAFLMILYWGALYAYSATLWLVG